MKTDIGLSADPTTCAFCGLKVKRHSVLMLGQCRHGLQAREGAAEAAVKAEAAEAAAKKSISEQLDDTYDAIKDLEDKRKELLFEEAKQEVREDEDFLEEVHKGCKTEQDVENAIDETREEYDTLAQEAWGYLSEFGGHTRSCLSGALAATQDLHPLCTCGWNHVATEAERA